MKIAFKKVDITPKLPVQLSGYGKLQVAYKVHDPLYARVFLIDDLLMVEFDLTLIDDFIINLISEKTGYSKDKMIISAIHSHAACGGTVDTYQGFMAGLEENVGGVLNPEYCHRICDLVANAVKELKKQKEEGQLKIYQGKVEGLGTNRHDPNLPCDEDCLILEWITPTKKALHLRLSCHPTVLNNENLEISADFVGAIEQHFEDYELVAFWNGSCGDMSTRFTRRAADFKELERYGNLISEQVKEIMNKKVPTYSNIKLEIENKIVTLPVKQVGSIEEVQETVNKARKDYQNAIECGITGNELRLILSVLEGCENNLKSTKAFASIKQIDMPIKALKLPNLTLIFSTVELFSILSNPMKKYGFEFIGYSNGYQGYLPDESAYDLNYYEASSTPYEKGAGELLMDEILNWQNK